MIRKIAGLFSILTLAAFISGCGSSGGSAAAPPPPSPPPPPPPASGWQPGVFAPWDGFFARCANPRNGTDPITGRPYIDVQGTLLDENNFLRSYSNDTYLWYDEIADQDPGLFNDPVSYFNELKTFAEIVPGVPKDPSGFHFSLSDEDYFQQFQAGVSVDYGIDFAFVDLAPPRVIYVGLTEPNSPATAANITRGARIVAIDGVDLVTSSAAMANTVFGAFFPESEGESHVFTIQDIGSPTTRDVTLTAEIVSRDYVQNVQVIESNNRRVGYMTFTGHRANAETDLIDAVNQFNQGAGIDDLVLDLRYNGGGLLEMAAQLAYMIAGPTATAGQTFELVRFNDKHPVIDPVIGGTIEPVPFVDVTRDWAGGAVPAGQPLPTLNLNRVFILATDDTCSASEAIINGLRGIDFEVILIGSTTCGKPYGFYPTPNCGNVYFTIQFEGVNAKGFGDYALGFVPSSVDDGMADVRGCPVDDDFTALLGDPTEDMLEAALEFGNSGACINPATTASPGVVSKPGVRTLEAEIDRFRRPQDTGKILLRR